MHMDEDRCHLSHLRASQSSYLAACTRWSDPLVPSIFFAFPHQTSERGSSFQTATVVQTDEASIRSEIGVGRPTRQRRAGEALGPAEWNKIFCLGARRSKERLIHVEKSGGVSTEWSERFLCMSDMQEGEVLRDHPIASVPWGLLSVQGFHAGGCWQLSV